jgi:hypothetical protein
MGLGRGRGHLDRAAIVHAVAVAVLEHRDVVARVALPRRVEGDGEFLAARFVQPQRGARQRVDQVVIDEQLQPRAEVVTEGRRRPGFRLGDQDVHVEHVAGGLRSGDGDVIPDRRADVRHAGVEQHAHVLGLGRAGLFDPDLLPRAGLARAEVLLRYPPGFVGVELKVEPAIAGLVVHPRTGRVGRPGHGRIEAALQRVAGTRGRFRQPQGLLAAMDERRLQRRGPGLRILRVPAQRGLASGRRRSLEVAVVHLDRLCPARQEAGHGHEQASAFWVHGQEDSATAESSPELCRRRPAQVSSVGVCLSKNRGMTNDQ